MRHRAAALAVPLPCLSPAASRLMQRTNRNDSNRKKLNGYLHRLAGNDDVATGKKSIWLKRVADEMDRGRRRKRERERKSPRERERNAITSVFSSRWLFLFSALLCETKTIRSENGDDDEKKNRYHYNVNGLLTACKGLSVALVLMLRQHKSDRSRSICVTCSLRNLLCRFTSPVRRRHRQFI